MGLRGSSADAIIGQALASQIALDHLVVGRGAPIELAKEGYGSRYLKSRQWADAQKGEAWSK